MSVVEQLTTKFATLYGQIDRESGLTITEKGNVKRFLTYAFDDVVVLVQPLEQRIKELEELLNDVNKECKYKQKLERLRTLLEQRPYNAIHHVGSIETWVEKVGAILNE